MRDRGFLNCGSDSFGHHGAACCVRTGKQDDELLPTISSNQVFRAPDRFPQSRGDGAQTRVAGLVTVAVVETA